MTDSKLPEGFQWENKPDKAVLPEGFEWEPSNKAADATPKAEGFTGRFGAGFKRSMPETKSLLVGAGAAAAGAVGAQDTADALLDKYNEINTNEVAPLASNTSFTDVVAGDGKLSEWAGDTLGNFAGQAAQSVVAATAGAVVGSALPGAGTVGGAIGGVVAKEGVKKLVGKKVASMVAKKAATAAGKKKLAGMAAGAAATTAMNTGQEIGIGYTGRAEDAAAAGEDLTPVDGLRAIGWGIPAGALDTVAEAFVAKGLFKGASADPKFIKRMLAGMVKGSLTEGGTEGAQAFLERMGADQDVGSKEAFLDYINNAAAGALGGGVAGGMGGFKRQKPELAAPNTQNTQPPADQPPPTEPPATTSGIDPNAGPISKIAAAAEQDPFDPINWNEQAPPPGPIGGIANPLAQESAQHDAGMDLLVAQHEEEQGRLFQIADTLGLDAQEVVNLDDSELGSLSVLNDYQLAAYAASLAGIPTENIANIIAPYRPQTAPAETAVPESVASTDAGQETPSGQTTPSYESSPTLELGGRSIGVTNPRAEDGNEIVMLDTEKADQSFGTSTEYVGRDGQGGMPERYQGVAKYLETADTMDAPDAYMDESGLRFTDGRHRFAYLRDSGVKSIPVSMTPEAAAKARETGLTTATVQDAPQPITEQAKIDEAAHAAATSDQNDLPQPTDAQKEAGNYKKGMVKVNGHDISIENPAGSQRDPKWPALANHYGYIKGTKGADKDHVDLFLTDKAADTSLPVFVVDQMNADGTFDEHKVIMGTATEAEARAAYKSNYSADFNGDGAITQMTQDEFKTWVYDANKTKRPAAETGPANDFMEVKDVWGKTHRVRAKHIDNPKVGKIPTYDSKGARIPIDIDRDKVFGDSDRESKQSEQWTTETGTYKDGSASGKIEYIHGENVFGRFAGIVRLYDESGKLVREVKLGVQSYFNSHGFHESVFGPDSDADITADKKPNSESEKPNSDKTTPPTDKEPARKLTKDEITAEMDRVLAVMAENEDLAGKDLAGITEAVRVEADKALPNAKVDQLARKVMKAMKDKVAADSAPDPNVRAKALVDAYVAAPSGTDLDQFEAGFDHALSRKTKSSLPEGDSYLAGYEAGAAFGKTPEGRKFVSKDEQKKMEGDAKFDLKRKMDKARASADKDGDSQERAILDVLKEGSARTLLMPNEEVAGESYGRSAALKFIRNKLKTFTHYMEDASSSGPFMESIKNYHGVIVDRSLEMSSGGRPGSDEAAIEYIKQGVFGTYDAANGIGTRAFYWVNKTERHPLEDQSADSRLQFLLNDRYTHYVSLMRMVNDKIIQGKTAPEVFSLMDEFVKHNGTAIRQMWRGAVQPSATEGAQWIIENDDYEFVGGRPLSRPGLDKISRTGMPDTRGRRDVLATEFKTTFGFTGTDFGDWVTGMEGQDNINYAYDAFSDLASLLNLPETVIGSDSGMYFTIGKLGSGRHAAHFNRGHPVKDEFGNVIGSVPVINITKTKGDGTISHEWGHALDLMLFTGEWHKLRRRFLSEFRKAAPTEAEVEDVVDKYLRGGWHITHRARGVESARYVLENFDHYYGGTEGARKKADRKPTSYYSEAMEADDGKSPKYWSNDAEMFTRAFEAYVYDKMQSRGADNNFLVNNWVKDGAVTKAKGYKAAIYPEGEERAAFNRMFDAMVTAMKMVDGKPHITQADFNTALAYIPTTKYYAGRSLIDQLLMPGVLEEKYKIILAEQQKKDDERKDLEKDRNVAKLFTEDQLKDPASRRIAAAQLAERLMSGRKLNILDVRKLISSTPVEPGTTYAKLIEETTELAVVIAARLTASNGHRANKTNAQIFDELVTLYNNQPNLSTRTSDSIAGQMYSTPAPLAFAASFLAGVDARTTVLEPTAGNGMLLLEANPVMSTVNEMDQVRYENLTQMTFRATQDNAATSPFASKSVDIVIANPPFGKTAAQERFHPQVPGGFPTQQIDHAISMAALDAMKEGGRAVLIVGSATGMSPADVKASYNSSSKRSFYSSLYQAYNVVAHLRIDGKLYSRQGASFPVDMIVIEGRGESQLPLPGVQVPETITSFDQLKEIIDARSRVVPASVGTPVGVDGGNGGTRNNDDTGQVDRPPSVTGPSPAEQTTGTGPQQGNAAGGQGPADGPGVPVDGVRGGKPGGNERTPVEPVTGDGRDGLADQGGTQQEPGIGDRNGDLLVEGQPGAVDVDGGRKSGRLDKVTNKTDDNPVSADKANSALERLKAAAAAKKALAEQGQSPPKKTEQAPAPKPTSTVSPQEQLAMDGQTRYANYLRENAVSPGGRQNAQVRLFSQPDEDINDMDPDMRQDFIDLSLNAIHDGARKFSDFVIKMTEYGLDAFSQFFKSLYKFVTGKNDYDDVDAPETVDKTETDAIINQAWDAWEKQDEAARDAASLDSKKTQVEYFPGSKVKSTGSLVPAGISEAIHQSLERLDAKVGGIDRYVGKSLGYLPGELGVYFSAEQVDAIALAIYAYEQGRGFIIGDQTGIGKGRVNAAMIRYALRNGMTPVFITEKPNLYTDMIRDLDDIGMSDELGLRTKDQRIVITNSGESYKYELVSYDSDGEPIKYEGILRPKKSKAETIDALTAVKSGKTPSIVFSTYSQSSQAGWRRNALTEMMPNAYLIIDESHNAGGTENARPKPGAPMNRAQYFQSLVIAAKGTFFSSATYAKRPSVMDLYSTTNMLLAVDGDADKLADAISSGGIPMQQAVAFMLAKDGQYIRRERSFAGIKYDTQRHTVDIEVADKIAGSLRDIYDFSLLRAEAIENLQKQITQIGGAVDKGDSIGVDGIDFSGVMHTVVKQSLLALKAKATVDYVVKRVKGEIVDENGNKNRPERVVVTVSSTMGALIQELKDDRKLKPGDSIDLRMNDIYLRHLERQRIVKYKYPLNRKSEIPSSQVAKAYLNDAGDYWIVEVRLTDQDLGSVALKKYNDILRQINDIDFGADTPASPIDYMHRMFAEAGVKTDEITGRNHTVRYGEIVGGHRTATYETRSSSIKSRISAIKGFNDGATEVLIINQSGSTGLSLHAAPKFENQQPRHMVIAQAEDNIDTHMQLLGRINRTGQLEIPAYTQFLADIPAEMRPASILAKKMASLNANTTGGKKSDVQSEDTVDFMNEYGGIIAYEFLEDNPDILQMLGGAAAKIMPADDSGIDEGIIRKLTGRIALLPVAVQERVYNELSERYTAMIAMLDAQGENKLEARAIDFRARTIDSLEITEGDPENDSEFAKASMLETIMGQQAFKPLTLAEIGVQVDAFLNGNTPDTLTASMRREVADFADKIIDRLRTEHKTASDKTKDPDELDALRMKANTHIAGVQQQKALMDMHLGTARLIGKTVEITDSKGSIIWGILLGVKANPKTENKLSLSSVEVVIALINGESRSISIPFSKLQNNSYKVEAKPTISWKDEVTGTDIEIDPRELLARMSHTREVKRYIATGNLLAAKAELKEGSIVRFTRADGTVDQGVLLPQSWLPDEYMRKRPIILNNEERIEFMRFTKGAKYGNTLSEVRRILMNFGEDSGLFAITVSIPSAKKFGAMTDQDLLTLLQDTSFGKPNFVTVGRGQPAEAKFIVRPDGSDQIVGRLSITYSTFHSLLKYLDKHGGPMVVTGAAQEAKDIRARNKPQKDTGGFSQPASKRRSRVSVEDANEALGNTAKHPNVVVVQSPEELPDSAKADEGYKTADGYFDGKIAYVVADNLRSADHARVVLIHELIGHLGMEAITGPAMWKQIDATIASMQKNPTFKKLFDEVNRRYPGADRATFVKEAIAVMAEKGIRNSVMDRIAAAIRQFIRAMGFTLPLSDAEIRAMVPLLIREQLSRSERFVADQAKADKAGVPAFSRNTMDQDELDAILEEYGEPVASSIDAERRWSNGELLFGVAEQEDGAYEITTFEMLGNHSYDSLLALPLAVAEEYGIRSTRGSTDTVTSTAKFKQWFGASKVVDAKGKPLAVFHGTASEFSAFDKLRLTSSTGHMSAPLGFFFAEDQAKAQRYAEKAADGVPADERVIDVYLSIKNPKKMTVEQLLEIEGYDDATDLREKLIARGFDGIHLADIGQWIAFEPTQIKSASENSGDFDPSNPSIYFSQPAPIMASEASLKKRLGYKITDIKPKLLAMIPMNYLVDFAHKKVSAIQNYIDTRYEMEQLRNTLHQKYDLVAQEWLALASADKRDAEELADVMHDSTIAGVDPSVDSYTYMTDLDKLETWRLLNARYMALSAEAKGIYKKARDSYTSQIKLLEDTLVDNFERAVSIQINRSERQMRKRIKDVNEDASLSDEDRETQLSEAEAAHEKRSKEAHKNARSRASALRTRFESMRVAAPYFPLARFGRYSIAVKRDGKIVSFSKREKLADAEQLRTTFEAQGLEVSIWLDDEKNNLRDAVDPVFIADIDEIISGSLQDVDGKDSDEVKAEKEANNLNVSAMRDAIYQRYLESLPDLSLRKSFIHRKKTTGYSDDALRAYSSTLFHGSYQIARLRYGMEMGEYLDVAAEQAKEFDPIQGKILVNEMRKRHEWVMNPKGSAAAQIATTGAFIYYLGANPAHLFLNATQTAMIGIPILGSKYGFGSTMKHLAAAAKLFFDTGGDISKALSGDELAAMQEFEKSGLLDKSQSHDIAGVGETGIEYSAVREKWMRKISWFFHKSEVFNREVTALASYRLAREAKNADGQTNRYGHSAAVRAARKHTYETHFDYSNANRPRFMQSDAMKILLVFRNYNINLLYRLFRDINDSMRGESAASKAEARKQLGAMMGMYALMAGVTGMPFYGLAMAIAGAFDDEDEPFGAEEQFKQGMVEYLGEDAARYILGGLPGTALNIDLRERIGLPNLWFRSADRELEGRDYYYYWMEQMLGANAGMAKSVIIGSSQVANGLKEMNGGDVERGVESMLPAAAKSVVKAGRYALEGQETNLDGDKIIDTDTGSVLARALGFTPQDLALQYDRNNTLKAADAKLLKRRTKLVNRYGLAAMAGDSMGSRDALKAIVEFNRNNKGYAITRGGLDRSLRLKARNNALNANGIVLNKRMQFLKSEMEGEE